MDEIEEEWRYVIHKKDITDEKSIDLFWGNIFKIKSGMDLFMFPKLKIFICALLILPHSSAAAERIFSDLNNIKTKNRNCLKTTTINSLLIVKAMTKNLSLFEWVPLYML